MQVTMRLLKYMSKVPSNIRNCFRFYFYVFQIINTKKKLGPLTRLQFLKECLHHGRFKCTMRRLVEILTATALHVHNKIMSFTHNVLSSRHCEGAFSFQPHSHHQDSIMYTRSLGLEVAKSVLRFKQGTTELRAGREQPWLRHNVPKLLAFG